MLNDSQRKPSLLVVDDEESIRFLLDAYFGAHGWTVGCAASCAEALKLLEGPPFDVAVLDLRLAKSDGVDGGIALMQEIVRRHPQTHNVFLTGYGSEASRQEALAKGASKVLDKPVRLETLRNIVTELVDGPIVQDGAPGAGAKSVAGEE